MTGEVEADIVALEMARARARLVRAFHVVFAGDEGQAVLDFLRKKFPPSLPRFGAHTQWDPLRAAVLDGQCQVLAVVDDFLSEPPGDDATAEPKPQPQNVT